MARTSCSNVFTCMPSQVEALCVTWMDALQGAETCAQLAPVHPGPCCLSVPLRSEADCRCPPCRHGAPCNIMTPVHSLHPAYMHAASLEEHSSDEVKHSPADTPRPAPRTLTSQPHRMALRQQRRFLRSAGTPQAAVPRWRHTSQAARGPGAQSAAAGGREGVAGGLG